MGRGEERHRRIDGRGDKNAPSRFRPMTSLIAIHVALRAAASSAERSSSWSFRALAYCLDHLVLDSIDVFLVTATGDGKSTLISVPLVVTDDHISVIVEPTTRSSSMTW